MSKLTEIMKQIPLNELTGDAEMIDRNEREITGREIKVSSGGALVRRRVGLIGTAAACAVMAAGGAFAYSKLSSSPGEEKRAAPVTSTVEGHSEAYSRNLAVYKEFYGKTLGADFSSVEKYVSPLEEESEVTEFEGLKLRVIGTRSIGPMLRVDIGVENPDKKYFYFRPSNNVTLTLPDGTSVDGTGGVLKRVDSDDEETIISYVFPMYQKNDDESVVSVNSGDKLKLTVGSIPVFLDDLNEEDHIKDYSAEFTYTAAAGGYDHTIETDTLSTWTSFIPEHSEDIKVRVKEINYSPAGSSLRFSIEGVNGNYTQKVLDLLCAGKISGYDKTKYTDYEVYALVQQGFVDDMAYIASDEVCMRYLTKFSSTNLWMIDKDDNGSDLILFNDFLDDPLPVEKITKFVFGTEKAEVAVPKTETSLPDSSEPEASEPDSSLPVKMEDVSITFDGFKLSLTDLKDKDRGYAAQIGFTVTDLPYDFDFAKTVSVQIPDGSKCALMSGETAKTGYLPENNINPHAKYTFWVDLNKNGIGSGSTLTLMIDDLYDMDGNKIVSGHYEHDFTVSYPKDDDSSDSILPEFDSNLSRAYLKKAVLYSWDDGDGNEVLDKSNAELFDVYPARSKGGFEGIDMGVAAVVRGTAQENGISRYLAPVVILQCKDRDGTFLSTDPAEALGVENEIYLKTADGKVIYAEGEGWIADGTETLICAPTFDLKDSGLKSGDKVTLYVQKLLSGAGDTLAEGEFTTELTL